MLEFLHTIEKLKREMRHSYISNGRQESVAEQIDLETYAKLVKHGIRPEKLTQQGYDEFFGARA